jgi:hypothetical protein
MLLAFSFPEIVFIEMNYVEVVFDFIVFKKSTEMKNLEVKKDD